MGLFLLHVLTSLPNPWEQRHWASPDECACLLLHRTQAAALSAATSGHVPLQAYAAPTMHALSKAFGHSWGAGCFPV